MENRSRAYRRWKQKCKFERRIKIWVPSGRSQYFMNTEDYRLVEVSCEEMREEIRKGKQCSFLRTTLRPCNCSMCTYEKYERPSKGELDKQIWDDIDRETL